ncbi:MAG: permease-like cell division protein FtsX [Candidatus Paceibacterota bacterium]|jgi:cell division transport system permease protein
MITTIVRITKYGWQNFTRNAWLSTATIAVMVLALSVFLGLMMFNVMTGTIISSIENKINISVYFKASTAEDDILNVQSQLKSLPEVAVVDYVSKDQALAAFEDKHQNDPTISQAIDQLGSNPLLASLNVRAYRPNQYQVIADYLNNNSSIQPFVEKISYAQNAGIIDRLNRILDIARRGGIGLTVFMSLVAMLITFNTIRLAIYSNRESITIMRLVGGSNFFVRGQFLVEGALYGILSALVSMLLIAPIVYFISPYGTILVPEMNVWQYFVSHSLLLFFYGLLFGVALGLISSFIAVGKYLRESQA